MVTKEYCSRHTQIEVVHAVGHEYIMKQHQAWVIIPGEECVVPICPIYVPLCPIQNTKKSDAPLENQHKQTNQK